jgi:3,4-dihydroxy 2-butanone 4-phosphate synthase/GTP cyclohydrolase II
MIESKVVVQSSDMMSTRYGPFRMLAFTAGEAGPVHLALVRGDPAVDQLLVRVHSECLTGDVLGSLRCDCGEQLDRALARIAAAGEGMVVYLRGHEGRGIGLNAKLRAYALQERGLDTVEANLALGLPVDDRDFAPAAGVLHHLGVRSVRLMSNNPAKAAALTALGVSCGQLVPMPATVTRHNERYLRTKNDRLGHRSVLPRADGVD